MKQMMKSNLPLILLLVLLFWCGITIAEWDDPDVYTTPSMTMLEAQHVSYETSSETPSETPYAPPTEGSSEMPTEAPHETPYATPTENPYENPYVTPYPMDEIIEGSDPDSTVLIEIFEPDCSEPTSEAFGEESFNEYPFVFFPDEESPDVARRVRIRRVMPDVLRDGDSFQIEAILIGFDGIEYELQWQYNDGSGWHSMPDANGAASLNLIADRYNVNYSWRIMIIYIAQTTNMEYSTIE